MPTTGKQWTSNEGSVFDASFSRSASANGFLTRAHFFMQQIKVRIWYWIHIWPLSKPFDVIKPPLIERINAFICHGNLFLLSLATLNSITALKSECKSRRCVSLLRRQVTSTSTLPPTEKKNHPTRASELFQNPMSNLIFSFPSEETFVPCWSETLELSSNEVVENQERSNLDEFESHAEPTTGTYLFSLLGNLNPGGLGAVEHGSCNINQAIFSRPIG